MHPRQIETARELRVLVLEQAVVGEAHLVGNGWLYATGVRTLSDAQLEEELLTLVALGLV